MVYDRCRVVIVSRDPFVKITLSTNAVSGISAVVMLLFVPSVVRSTVLIGPAQPGPLRWDRDQLNAIPDREEIQPGTH